MTADLLDGLDPITFEVLSHRLTSIHTELAATIKAMSGSPVATEAGDFNTSVMDASGNALAVGVLVTAHAVTQSHIVKYILTAYGPAFVRAGDMFLANDPYLGALHQSDVICVAPVFVDDELVAWVGSAVHQVDVGGPVAGGFAMGARSIYEEPAPFPPLRFVEGGIVRPDIEGEYLRRSRRPELLQLDLRAQVGANRVADERLRETFAEFGRDEVLRTFDAMKKVAVRQLRERVAELPRGSWHHTLLLDHDGLTNDIYAVDVVLTHDAETLVFDFTGSSPQAPALVNCSRPALEGSVIAAVLPLLCPDIAWCPAAVDECIRIESREGTICHAQWPAGVSAGSVSASRVVTIASAVAIGEMLAGSKTLSDRAAAGWAGSAQSLNMFGTRADGTLFGTMILDSVAGGSAATSTRDGLDSGGSLTSMSTSIANVETNEYMFPMLYLYRRHNAGSGGAGKYRGGRGVEIAFAMHGISDESVEAVVISHGVAVDPSPGLLGGQPGGRCSSEIVRNVELVDVLTTGRTPDDRVEILPSKARFTLGARDVYIARAPGGSGFGSPQDRSGAADEAQGTGDRPGADPSVTEVESWTLVNGARAVRRRTSEGNRVVDDRIYLE